jgi:hydroxylamine dehydrogenase
MKTICALFFAVIVTLFADVLDAAEVKVSEASQACIECHRVIHPGIVADWERSRHFRITPKEAMAVKGLGLKVSSPSVPEELQGVAVGCAECHTLRPKEHADTFEHNGYDIHIVVSPGDCRTCHVQEADQYSKNIMAHAYKNLAGNKLYNDLENTILGGIQRKDGKWSIQPAHAATKAEACYYCHGTKLKVTGKEVRNTAMAGELEFPKIDGWPNQGVGRVNLDGTLGSCAACHTRHQCSIEMARKPYTCKECHIGPDVPVNKVYEASKHGNIFSTHNKDWEFKAVPWTIGKDFTAPTCAACHVSLVVNTEGEVVAQRSHQMNDRLPWRMFGLVYAHPHPREPDTTIIRNKNGQPLPTDLDGGFATKFLIDKTEMDKRRQTLQSVCLSCHGTSWVNGQWARFENTLRETNASTREATRIIQEVWAAGLASGPDQKASPFDEGIERRWADTWLIYANTIRFASAMGCGGDYGVFADGRYQLNKAIVELHDWLELRKQLQTSRKN